MHKRRRLATRLCRVDRTTMANSCASLLFFLAPLHFFLASEAGRTAKVQRVWEGSLVKCIQNQAPKQILRRLAFDAPQPAAWLPGQVAIAPLTVPKQLPAQRRLHQHQLARQGVPHTHLTPNNFCGKACARTSASTLLGRFLPLGLPPKLQYLMFLGFSATNCMLKCSACMES